MGYSIKNIKGKVPKYTSFFGADINAIAPAIGVTTQRETAVAWDKETGEPLRNTIIWSDIRTDELVHSLKSRRDAAIVKERSGLDLSSYFSAVKFKWMLEHDKQVQQAVKEGRACFGTVDSWLIYKLSAGKVHVTDVTSASRTLLMNLTSLEWDPALLEFFDIPQKLLPRIASCSEIYSEIQIKDNPLFGIPIAGCLGDQQAALLGQARKTIVRYILNLFTQSINRNALKRERRNALLERAHSCCSTLERKPWYLHMA
jgi:glycerol kinase